MKEFTHILLISAAAITALYFLLILFFIYGWRRLKVYEARETPTASFSVIIAARNEEKNIERCLRSLIRQEIGAARLEIIVVDDHSEDDTAKIVSGFAQQFPCITLLKADEASSGKKAALKKGIEASSGELLVFTDADCTFGSYWLWNISCFYQETKADMILLPVLLEGGGMQALEFFSLTAVTAASAGAESPLMCNGAGLAYTRQCFDRLGGFDGNSHFPSGDDMMMLQKLKASGGMVQYLLSYDAIVHTPPQPGIKAFFDQRIRWASKTKYYSDKFTVLVSLLVFLASLIPMGALVSGLFYGSGALVWIAAGLLIFKAMIDFLFLFLAAKFFKRTGLLNWFLPVQILYPFYVLITGCFSLFGSYKWKGRIYPQAH